MSKELAIKEEISLDAMLNDIDAMQKMAQKLMQTKHYQAMGEAGVFAIIQRSKALGISPLEGLNGGLYFVGGKTGMSSELMASLIRKQGHSITKDPKSDNNCCILHGKRADNGDTWRVSFSMEDAKRAQIDKNMWLKYPSVMCYNRALSMLARQLFPDVIKGAGYTMDELKEISASKGISPEELEDVTEMASVEAIHELLHMIGRTPADYQNRVIDFLNKHGLVEDKITMDLYNQTFERVTKKLEELQAELKETKLEVESE